MDDKGDTGKMMKRLPGAFLILLLPIFFVGGYCHELNSENWRKTMQYLEPQPDAKRVTPENNVIIRPGQQIDIPTEQLAMHIQIQGTKSGIISGNWIITPDLKTVIFKPYRPFEYSESIEVQVSNELAVNNPNASEHVTYSFTTRSLSSSIPQPEMYSPEMMVNNYFPELQNSMKPGIVQEPLNFRSLPNITTTTFNDPAPGKIFLTIFSLLLMEQSEPTLLIMDNYSTPVYYNIGTQFVFNFATQSDTSASYFHAGSEGHIVIDRNYNQIDYATCGNGYMDNIHEFLILENGNSLMICSDDQIINMDSLVVGGDPEALVRGNHIQEQDPDGNVIFQWRSWDHVPITDAAHHIDLTSDDIDYIHMNSLDLDFDGNILLSSRNLDEITKIDRETGEIIWRMGGPNNQYTFINDERGFSVQHYFKKLDTGNYILYNNGNFQEPRYSDAIEFNLDQTELTAEIMWNYADSVHLGLMMGNAQRLENGNTLIFWGPGTGEAALTEVHEDGEIALEVNIPFPLSSYRAIKSNWETTLFDINPDTMTYQYADWPINVRTIEVTNNSESFIQINHFSSHDSVFTITSELPRTILAGQSAELEVTMLPQECGPFENILTVGMNTFTEYIADQAVITGDVICTPNGDMNYNIYLNIVDIILFVDIVLDEEGPNEFQLAKGDLDFDGSLTVRDLVAIVTLTLEGGE